jgi:hypothetical protein
MTVHISFSVSSCSFSPSSRSSLVLLITRGRCPGAKAYAISRRGMEEVLAAYWPTFASAPHITQAGTQQGASSSRHCCG